jgi:hypothetical protein
MVNRAVLQRGRRCVRAEASEEDESRHGSAYDVGQRCATRQFCNAVGGAFEQRTARRMRAVAAARMNVG